MLRIAFRLTRSHFSTASGFEYPHAVHAFPDATRKGMFAVSFLSQKEGEGRKGAVIGWTEGKVDPRIERISPKGFMENSEFVDVFHEVVGKNVHLDEGVKAMALNQKEGYLNVNDTRVFVPWGRVGDPEDILGSVRLDKGTIVPGSYERMPTHRLVSLNGLFLLSDILHEKLVKRLKEQKQ